MLSDQVPNAPKG
jgi:hypothetical protein